MDPTHRDYLIATRQHINKLGLLVNYFHMHTHHQLTDQMTEMHNTLDKLDHTIASMQVKAAELVKTFPDLENTAEVESVIRAVDERKAAATTQDQTLPPLFGEH
jgi:hypothetical protein